MTRRRSRYRYATAQPAPGAHPVHYGTFFVGLAALAISLGVPALVYKLATSAAARER